MDSLTYVLTNAKLEATGHCWLEALSTFFFKPFFQAGKKDYDADTLSQRPPEESPKDH